MLSYRYNYIDEIDKFLSQYKREINISGFDKHLEAQLLYPQSSVSYSSDISSKTIQLYANQFDIGLKSGSEIYETFKGIIPEARDFVTITKIHAYHVLINTLKNCKNIDEEILINSYLCMNIPIQISENKMMYIHQKNYGLTFNRNYLPTKKLVVCEQASPILKNNFKASDFQNIRGFFVTPNAELSAKLNKELQRSVVNAILIHNTDKMAYTDQEADIIEYYLEGIKSEDIAKNIGKKIDRVKQIYTSIDNKTVVHANYIGFGLENNIKESTAFLRAIGYMN